MAGLSGLYMSMGSLGGWRRPRESCQQVAFAVGALSLGNVRQIVPQPPQPVPAALHGPRDTARPIIETRGVGGQPKGKHPERGTPFTKLVRKYYTVHTVRG